MPGNRDKLIQAFLNLVKNAAEAIEEGREPGRIVLRTAFRPGVRLSVPGTGARVSLPLMIEVEDNGPGVPDELKPHLFDPVRDHQAQRAPAWGWRWWPRSSATTAASSNANRFPSGPCFACCCRMQEQKRATRKAGRAR